MTPLSPVLAKSDSLIFHWCDGCDSYHAIDVDKPNPYTGALWAFNGDVNKPTFHPSINIVGQCHYFIRDGNIEYCTDSKHHLAGLTVSLPLMP